MSGAQPTQKFHLVSGGPAEDSLEPTLGANARGSSGDILITRKEIAERLNVSDGKLRAYAEIAPEFFGGIDAGGKGVRYPLSAIDQFADVMGKFTPATFRDQIAAAGGAASAATMDLARRGDDQAMMSLAPVLTKVVEQMVGIAEALRGATAAASALPVAPDRLLDGKEAAAKLSCSTSTVGRHVKPVKVGRMNRWKESDLNRYISTLG